MSGTALYTTVANVEALTGQTYGTATTPTSDQVETFIGWASRDVDLLSDSCWGTAQVVQEVYDFDVNKSASDVPWGSGIQQPQGRVDNFWYNDSNSIRLNNFPIISVGAAEYNESTNATTTESWVSMTEGTGNDFIIDKEVGKVILTGNIVPSYGYRRFRFTYTWGRNNVPSYVEHLTTLMVQREILLSKQTASNIGTIDSVTIGPITITKAGAGVTKNLQSINEEIDKLVTRIGGNTVRLI